MSWSLLLSLVLFVIIPTISFALHGGRGVTGWVLDGAHSLLIFLLFLSGYLFLQHIVKGRVIRGIMAFAASMYLLLLYFLVGYLWYTGGAFDLFFMLDSADGVLPMVLSITGFWGLLFVTTFSLIGVFLLSRVLAHTLLSVHSFSHRFGFVSNGALALFLLLGVGIVPPAYGSPFAQVEHVQEVSAARQVVVSRIPDNSHFATESDESVFMLQYESGNALALNGRAVVDGTHYSDFYLPVLRSITERDGIFLPYMWGGGVQTNRGQATILCGIVNDLGDAFSYSPEEITTPCLPEILRKAGYRTVFLSAFWDGGFANTEDFMKKVGFDDVIFATDLMEEGDPKNSWAYDDCAFYDRVFEYLRKNYPDPRKLFVYVSVGMNHIPFNPQERYAALHPFPNPSTFIEEYIDSAVEQDHCTARFYEQFQRYTDERTHLFVLPDHSWPIGINGNTYNERNAYNDNFLIFAAYIPPRARRGEFRIGEQEEGIYGQSDIIPTIFDLLNEKSEQNSFAFALRQGEPRDGAPYEDCHVLAQPYGGAEVAVVRGNEKVIYSVSDHSLISFDLQEDFLEQDPRVIAEDLSYNAFLQAYSCERYGTKEVEAREIWSEGVHMGDEVASVSWGNDPWRKFFDQEPLGRLDIPFVVSPGTVISHIALDAADMERGNTILIDDAPQGITCSTGGKRWKCFVTLQTPWVAEGRTEHVLSILAETTGGGSNVDDFVLQGVELLGG